MKRNFFYRFLQTAFLFLTLCIMYSAQSASRLYLPSPGSTTAPSSGSKGSSFGFSSTPIGPWNNHPSVKTPQWKNPFPKGSPQAIQYEAIRNARINFTNLINTGGITPNLINHYNNILNRIEGLLNLEQYSLVELKSLYNQLLIDIGSYKSQISQNTETYLRKINQDLKKPQKDPIQTQTLLLMKKEMEEPPKSYFYELESTINDTLQRSKQKIQDLTPPQSTIIGVPSQDTPLLLPPPPPTPMPTTPTQPFIQPNNNQATLSTQLNTNISTQKTEEKTPTNRAYYDRLHRLDAQKSPIVTEQNLTYAQNQNAFLEQTLQMIKDKKMLPVFMQINPDGFHIKTDAPNPEEQKYTFISRHSESLTLEHQKAGSSPTDVCELLVVEKDHTGPNGRYCKITLPLANVDQIPFLAGEINIESGDLCDKPIQAMPKVPQQKAPQKQKKSSSTIKPKRKIKLIPNSINDPTITIQPTAPLPQGKGKITINGGTEKGHGMVRHGRNGRGKRTSDGNLKTTDNPTTTPPTKENSTATLTAASAEKSTAAPVADSTKMLATAPDKSPQDDHDDVVPKDGSESDGANQTESNDQDSITQDDGHKESSDNSSQSDGEKKDDKDTEILQQEEPIKKRKLESSENKVVEIIAKGAEKFVVNSAGRISEDVSRYLIQEAFAPPFQATPPPSPAFKIFPQFNPEKLFGHFDPTAVCGAQFNPTHVFGQPSYPIQHDTSSSSSSTTYPIALLPTAYSSTVTSSTPPNQLYALKQDFGDVPLTDVAITTTDSLNTLALAYQQHNNPQAAAALDNVSSILSTLTQKGVYYLKAIAIHAGKGVNNASLATKAIIDQILMDPVKATQAFANFSTRSALQLSKLSLQFLFDQEALADSTQATLDALSKHISTMSKGQLLEKSVELTLYMCMPGGISRYLGGMVGIQEASTVSQAVDSITTALQAEYAHAMELAGTNMTMKQICAPFSNSIYQNLKTVDTTAKIAQEEGLGVAKQAFETVENNPGLVANSGSSVAEAMQKVAGQNSRLHGLQDILEDAVRGEKTKGSTLQFEKKGGFEQACKDFQKLGVTEIQDIAKGKVGKLPDGRTVNVRTESTAKVPTLEIYDPKTKKSVKFRYHN